MKYLFIFVPAIISVDYEVGEKASAFKIIATYAKYAVLINFLMLLSLLLIGRGSADFEQSVSVTFYSIYLLGSLILAIVLPRLFKYCRENFSFKIKREKNEKK